MATSQFNYGYIITYVWLQHNLTMATS